MGQYHTPVCIEAAHGAWRAVEKATAARDVPPGQNWAFRDHRTMSEAIADEKSVTP